MSTNTPIFVLLSPPRSFVGMEFSRICVCGYVHILCMYVVSCCDFILILCFFINIFWRYTILVQTFANGVLTDLARINFRELEKIRIFYFLFSTFANGRFLHFARISKWRTVRARYRSMKFLVGQKLAGNNFFGTIHAFFYRKLVLKFQKP
jgi:hypothetical protein